MKYFSQGSKRTSSEKALSRVETIYGEANRELKSHIDKVLIGALKLSSNPDIFTFE